MRRVLVGEQLIGKPKRRPQLEQRRIQFVYDGYRVQRHDGLVSIEAWPEYIAREFLSCSQAGRTAPFNLIGVVPAYIEDMVEIPHPNGDTLTMHWGYPQQTVLVHWAISRYVDMSKFPKH